MAKTKKKKEPIGLKIEDLKRHFSNEDIRKAHGYMKRCSTSIITRENKLEP